LHPLALKHQHPQGRAANVIPHHARPRQKAVQADLAAHVLGAIKLKLFRIYNVFISLQQSQRAGHYLPASNNKIKQHSKLLDNSNLI